MTVNGDGGFLMNCQELETAVRLRTPFVNMIWENGQYGSIVWKQDKKFGRHFGTDFTNPDFVRLAESFGLPAWRCESADDFGARLRHALALDLPSVIVLPIDYSLDVAIVRGTGNGDRGDMSIATAGTDVVDRVQKKLFIGGEWRDGAAAGTLAVRTRRPRRRSARSPTRRPTTRWRRSTRPSTRRRSGQRRRRATAARSCGGRSSR